MIIDLFFVILMVIACMKGIKKGFLLSLLSFVGLFVGIAISIKFSSVTAIYLSTHTSIKSTWLPFLSFVLLFGTTVIVFQLVGRFFKKTTDATLLGWFDKLGGVCLFMLLYGVLYSVFLFYIVELHIIGQDTIHQSYSYKYLSPLAPDVMNFWGRAIPFFKNTFQDLNTFFNSKLSV